MTGQPNKSSLSLLIVSAVLTCIYTAQPAAKAQSADASKCYTQKDTFGETMLATRWQFSRWSAAEHTAGVIKLGPWFTTGCLKTPKFKDALFPEKSVNLKAKGSNGKALWKKQKRWKDGVVQGLERDIVGSTYIYRTITAARDMTITVSLGSDDGLAVWLNGKILLSKDVPRGVTPGQDRVELNLKAGQNHLLLKIYNMRGGHGFYFSTSSHPAIGLWKMIEKDFPVEAGWLSRDAAINDILSWFDEPGSTDVEKKLLNGTIASAGGAASAVTFRCRADA